MTPWLELCRAAVGDLREVFAAMPTRSSGSRWSATAWAETRRPPSTRPPRMRSWRASSAPRGGGRGLPSRVRGARRATFGTDPKLRVVVDPIDGSLNAKRNIPYFSVSIAVAEGATMKDVVFGFVHDFGTGEEWTAERGKGARLNGEPLGAIGPKEKSRCWRSRRPSPCPSPRRRSRSLRSPSACGSWARWPSRSARSRRGASTRCAP